MGNASTTIMHLKHIPCTIFGCIGQTSMPPGLHFIKNDPPKISLSVQHKVFVEGYLEALIYEFENQDNGLTNSYFGS